MFSFFYIAHPLIRKMATTNAIGNFKKKTVASRKRPSFAPVLLGIGGGPFRATRTEAALIRLRRRTRHGRTLLRHCRARRENKKNELRRRGEIMRNGDLGPRRIAIVSIHQTRSNDDQVSFLYRCHHQNPVLITRKCRGRHRFVNLKRLFLNNLIRNNTLVSNGILWDILFFRKLIRFTQLSCGNFQPDQRKRFLTYHNASKVYILNREMICP